LSTICFITHPEVVIDPTVPVPRWHLSEIGIARMRAFASSPAMASIRTIWASTETKAIEGAGIVAARHALPVSVHAGLDENDRSATGFLPPEEFQRTANAFFANPNVSVRGWERAVDAQRRVVAAFDAITAAPSEGDIAIVGHGGVGTLLYCHLAGRPISREHDQPAQGHYWTYALQSRSMLHGWRSISTG